ncbi:hypothetical protein A8709_07530 [Paenibacillus pectinilyticus]|uniref:Uncharacterized protein n=1 Tax=Paenibacillus pectinilyticus TaxID=512399 RepID=A0A1C0ZTV4_9BACL|nr:Ger(x)C family spore germination protein [Paenibacillus pectinilyticus]OCT11507.1 hypothetical protein A8709_07530 [Paenibacillus pectinilyticus]
MKAIQTILIILFMLTLSGCWNSKELDQISITTAIGIDKKDNTYNVSVQLLNNDEIASNNAVGQRLPVVTLQVGSGSTIFESMRMLTTTSPRKINTSHLRILVIGEEMAKEGIGQMLDVFSRDHELRSDFNILVAKNTTARELLQVLTPLEKIPANKLYSSLVSSAKNWGITSNIDLHQLIYDLVDPGKEPVLSSVHIKGNPVLGKSRSNLNSVIPPTVLQYQGLAVFHKDQLAGWFTDRESKGYNYALGNIDSSIVVLPCQAEGLMSIELIRTKANIKANFMGEHPEANVHVQVEGNIGEVSCPMNLNTTQTIQTIEQQLSEEIKQTIQDAVNKAKSYKSDIFGFGTAVHRANYKKWNLMKDHWDQVFVDLPVHVTVQAKIKETGSVVESFIDTME